MDEQQIQKAKASNVPKEDIESAKKFLKNPQQIAELITDCLKALEKAGVEGIGYLQNATDKYLNESRSVGIRDDRKADGTLDNIAHIGEHAFGNYKYGIPQWKDLSDEIIQHLRA